MLSEEDFYEKAKNFALLKDVDNKYYTYEEYREAVKENQTDKDDRLICLYTSDPEAQYAYVEAAKAKGYNVLLLNGQTRCAAAQHARTEVGKDVVRPRRRRHVGKPHPQG